MERRVEDLEVKVAFQEKHIADLDEVIRQLRDEVDDLRARLHGLHEEVRLLTPGAEDAKPPHY
jgi:uncharacterized coiled-coil protein SlyX